MPNVHISEEDMIKLIELHGKLDRKVEDIVHRAIAKYAEEATPLYEKKGADPGLVLIQIGKEPNKDGWPVRHKCPKCNESSVFCKIGDVYRCWNRNCNHEIPAGEIENAGSKA